jgi:hypothetical protein
MKPKLKYFDCKVSIFKDCYLFEFDSENYLMLIKIGFWEALKYIENSKKIKLTITHKHL